MFIVGYDERDLREDLQRRTQARGERIMEYLVCVKYLVSRFKYPPSEEEVTEIVFRNLLPEYRRAMIDHVIEDLDDIEKYGRVFEKRRDADRRYVPPPPAEKMHVPACAPRVTATKKVAAAQDVSQVEQGKASKKKIKKESKIATMPELGKGGESTIVAHIEATQATNVANRNANTSRVKAHQVTDDQGQSTGSERVYVGACYVCQAVGHRASECPERQCFRCRQKGHYAKECAQPPPPRRKPELKDVSPSGNETTGEQHRVQSP